MKLKGINLPGYRIDKNGKVVKDKKRLNLCAQLASKGKVRFGRNHAKPVGDNKGVRVRRNIQLNHN